MFLIGEKMNKTPNLLHRFNGSDLLDNYQLFDAVDGMTDRACSVLTLIASEFSLDRDMRLNDEIIFNALQSVEMELHDIKSTVDHFYRAQKSPIK